MEALRNRIAAATGLRPTGFAPLPGGCIGEVYRVALDDGSAIVAKVGKPGDPLALEGWMLGYLSANSALPVPEVLHAEDSLLLMSHVESGDSITPAVETDAAAHLAALHGVTAPSYGLERDTVIGGLHQPNPESAGWIGFFRDHRLLYMARQALDAGRLEAPLMGRIERFAARLDGLLDEPAAPSLVHGDMWAGNVLARGDRVAGFIDPAVHYADAEMDLAFSTLFATFGEPFFRRYGEIRPIRPGFFEARRDICNLWPLLVHVRLFGGSYGGQIARILGRFGC